VSTPALFAARHAPVVVEGICYGQFEVPTRVDASAACAVLLDQLGREQVHVTRVWASPWSRTRETAACVASRLEVPLVIDARLSELAFGEWEGRAYAELERTAPFQEWMRNWRDAAPPGGERLEDLVARVRAWRREVLDAGEVALVVTHAGVIRVLRAEKRGVAYDEVLSEPVEGLRLERVDPIPSDSVRA
jgi:alpha-ribazole phosphatase